jgi:lysophospholipase L1-like esterase
MKRSIYLFILTCMAFAAKGRPKVDALKLFTADNARIQYNGRIDFSDKLKPRIWAPGVYIMAKFKGSRCEILINDEASGSNHNYLEIVIDDRAPYRVELTGKTNVLHIPEGLSASEHTILICKDTESNIGYIDFIGLRCKGLLQLPKRPKRKIEYFGDSITSGTGMDLSIVPCDKGQWFDQHNAYMSYGPRTSRTLNAQWQLTALAGVGLIHSCCNMKVLMPGIYDKVFLSENAIPWDFSKYQPDVVTVCLGQNDGPQDSTLFCGTYVKFISAIRQHYPLADIICLTSPMADSKLTPVLQRYLTGITSYVNAAGDKKVYKYFFSKQYHNGCGGHPDMDEHARIADELTAYIKQVERW